VDGLVGDLLQWLRDECGQAMRCKRGQKPKAES
jgi:hypothetical protein